MTSKIQFNLFSVPVLIIGLFLTTTIAYVVLEVKRKEIGLMKVRGAADVQVKKMLAIEILTIGLISGILWPGIATLVSLYLVNRFATLWGVSQSVAIYFVDMNTYLYMGIFFSFLLAAVAAYIPYRIVATMRPVDAINRSIEHEETKTWKPKWVSLGVILGGYNRVS